MRLDDPQLQPGESQEQRTERLARAARLTKIANQGRALSARSGLTVRILRLTVMLLGGLFLLSAGLLGLGKPPVVYEEWFMTRTFGPYGNVVAEIGMGLLLTATAIFFLRNSIRDMRAGKYPLPK